MSGDAASKRDIEGVFVLSIWVLMPLRACIAVRTDEYKISMTCASAEHSLMPSMRRSLAIVLALCHVVIGQSSAPIPNTWPNAWPGQPSGDYSPDWQTCKLCILSCAQQFMACWSCADFAVTETLPNITGVFDIPRSYAGSISVNRAGHPNDTLFFWGFEKTGANGSLTDANSTDPWIIWLQGG